MEFWTLRWPYRMWLWLTWEVTWWELWVSGTPWLHRCVLMFHEACLLNWKSLLPLLLWGVVLFGFSGVIYTLLNKTGKAHHWTSKISTYKSLRPFYSNFSLSVTPSPGWTHSPESQLHEETTRWGLLMSASRNEWPSRSCMGELGSTCLSSMELLGEELWLPSNWNLMNLELDSPSYTAPCSSLLELYKTINTWSSNASLLFYCREQTI